ncbi:hypothetical protein BH20ACI1_BH20ACI1_18070 [soil metagenome]
MDFEFDKEIDVLLRQARKGETVFTATTPQLAHLDADEISAFAENALPEKAKQIYTAHLADCDSCRKSLSDLILLNAENESEIAPASENVIIASPTISWYRKLFALPNLAYTMGALIVLFGGIIGFMVLQNLNISQNTEVAKINEKSVEQMPSESVVGTPELSSSANANMALNSNDATIYSSNSMMSNAPMNSNMSVAPNKPVPSLAEPKKEESRSENDLAAVNKESDNFSVDGVAENQVNKNFVQGVAAGRRNQRSQDDPRDKNSAPQIPVSPESPASDRQVSELPENSRQNDALLSSPSAKSESKKAKTSGAIENEKTIVSGKTFNRKNNVWYDADYNQQSTINITRGTEKYKKLDKGLRTIVENLGGTVVIVWKKKAYRIQ